MNTINKMVIGMAGCALFLTLAVLGFSINIETKPEAVSAAVSCSQAYEYMTTGASTAVGTASTITGSAVTCQAAPAGWTLVNRACTISGGPCYSEVCLWKKPASQNLDYKLTHAGTKWNMPAINCATEPAPAGGYSLKSRTCSIVGDYGCISDICLWEKTGSTSNVKNFLLNNQAMGLHDTVNCAAGNAPASGYSLNSRVGILSFTTNTYSDLCLWESTEQCSTANVACNSNSDCGANGYIDNSFCSGNAVYRNYKTYTCNNAGTGNAYCSSSVSSQVQTTCANNQTCSNGACVTNTTNVACNSNADCGSSGYIDSSFCSGNSVYRNYKTYTCNNAGTANSYCSTSTTNQLQASCSGNQTCSNGACVTNVSTCTNHSYYRCSGNGVYWFDSCGNRQELYQACTGNQTCPAGGNICVNVQNVQTNVAVTVQVRNLSAGNLQWSNSVSAGPSDVLQYNITIQNSGNTNVNNIILKDVLPSNLYYNNFMTIDGQPNAGNITTGVNIGSLSPGQTRTVTYQVQVAPSQNFSFGTTTLTNMVTATSNDPAGTYGSGSSSIVVTRSGILGATTVSTGLTNNIWVDSFLLPLILALLGVWAWKSGLLNSFGFAGWVNTKKSAARNMVATSALERKISEIKNKETL